MWDRGVYSLLVKQIHTDTMQISLEGPQLKLELLYNIATLLLGIHQDHNDEEKNNVGKTVFLHAKEQL